MSDHMGTVKPDSMLAHFLWGHDDFREGFGENGGLTGDEIDTYKVNDTGESMVADPVADFVRKASLDRFDASTQAETTFATRGKTRIEKTLYPLTHVAVCAEIDNQTGAVLRVYEEKTEQRDRASGTPAVDPMFAKLVAVD
jgi:hypothetical protein